MAEKSTNVTAQVTTPEPTPQLSISAQKRLEMDNLTSDLRNQVTPDDIMDFQLLSNTPAQIIAAMTSKTMNQLEARAKELEVTLKGSLAGSLDDKA